MDAWAASYGSAVAFICVSCAGPQLATQFGSQLKLKHCFNTWVDNDDMPTWGQLGCNGLIVLDGAKSVICKASPAFLEVKESAFRYVETLLDALIAQKAAPAPKSGRVDESVGGACAKVRFGSDGGEETNGEEADDASPAKVAKSGGAALKVPSVKVAVLDAEHERCEAALAQLAARRDSTSVRELLSAYEEHFAHEEALLDEHLYAGVEKATGFSADKGARSSHFADHEAMLSTLRKMLTEFERRAVLAKELGLDDAVGGSISEAEAQKLAADFELHATAYDGNYADRLSAAMAAVEPVAIA